MPPVYDQLRQVANKIMAQEPDGHSLQATALVHEAYLRLSQPQMNVPWGDANHFSAIVVEVMRRILVESARKKKRLKRGGAHTRVDLDPDLTKPASKDDTVLVVDEALTRLAAVNSNWAQLVKLRFFLGMTVPEAAQAMRVSPRTVDSWWCSAREWMMTKLALDLDLAVT